MKFADHLSRKTIRKFNQIKSAPKEQKQTEPTPNKPEQLSRKDIVELMGMNRDRYTRGHGGAIRRQ